MTIKELRLKYHLSQQELADKTGIPRPRIAKWEEGKSKPKAEDQRTLDNYFASIDGEVEDPQEAYLRKSSLEKSIENLTQNELRTTSIIERLVTLLERKYAGGNFEDNTYSEKLDDKKRTSSKAG